MDRDDDLAAHVSALLREESWSSRCTPTRPLDHRLDELERVERAAEAGFGVRDDRPK